MLGQSPVPMAAVADPCETPVDSPQPATIHSRDSPCSSRRLKDLRSEPTSRQSRGKRGSEEPTARPGVGDAPSPRIEPVERDPAEAEPVAAAAVATTAEPPTMCVAISPDPTKGWGEGARQKRSGSNATAKPARGAKSEKRARAAPGRPAGAPATTAVHAAKPLESDNAANVTLVELVPAVRAVAASAPESVLKHALRWIDLVVADLKGRGAALRRSRRRLQRVRNETENAAQPPTARRRRCFATSTSHSPRRAAAWTRCFGRRVRNSRRRRGQTRGWRSRGRDRVGERRGRPRNSSGEALLGSVTRW